MSFETDTESKNDLEPGSSETVSRYSTTLEMDDTKREIGKSFVPEVKPVHALEDDHVPL